MCEGGKISPRDRKRSSRCSYATKRRHTATKKKKEASPPRLTDRSLEGTKATGREICVVVRADEKEKGGNGRKGAFILAALGRGGTFL